MYDLKAYLESTDSAVPPKLANHAAAKAPWGSIGENGKVVGQKRDTSQEKKRASEERRSLEISKISERNQTLSKSCKRK